MKVRADDGCVYFAASKWGRDVGVAEDVWEVSYIGPSIIDSLSDFDSLAAAEGTSFYLAGTLHNDGTLSIGTFFSRGLGWIIEGGKVRTCIFATLEADVKAAIRECEEAAPYTPTRLVFPEEG